jgi:hypothetical protein
MLRLQVDQPRIRVAYRLAFTYAVQRNPQKKSGQRRAGLTPSLFTITQAVLGGLSFAQALALVLQPVGFLFKSENASTPSLDFPKCSRAPSRAFSQKTLSCLPQRW